MKRALPRLLVLASILAAYAFFGWHAKYGARSLAYQAEVRQKLADTRARLEAVRARRKAMEARNALLRGESLDPDMLEEMARRQLGFAAADEFMSPAFPGPKERNGR
jgi:cell division protein FtsB